MTIHSLPPSTVRLLGASVTITAPYDLVKELLENAIDAEATAIEVSISADTLSSISVRDNGHGIAPPDFDSLGRRAHTSKLRSYDELQIRGGDTLGFRGEALAAANAVADLSIVTRVAGEPIASRLEVRSPGGGIESCRPVSAPVGTTVLVARLFDRLPVRRQHLLREKGRSMAAIKRLLQSYALARPHLRLSLRVLEDAAQTWRYSPNHSPTVQEAALQIFGRALAANCTRLVFPSKPDNSRPSGLVLDAFVPRPDCDVKAVRGGGLFVSVDQRPLSPSRRLPKKIAGLLASRLSEHLAGAERLFMRLDIRCPPRTYDPNITPLKDDVLFGDEEAPLKCFEQLCQQLCSAADSTTLDSSPLDGDDNDGIPSSLFDDADILSFLAESVSKESWPKVDQGLAGSDLEAPKQQTGGIEHTHPNEGSVKKSYQPKEAAATIKAVAVKMRTLIRVDMTRSDSNATDEDDLVELTGVVIPPRPTKPPSTSGPPPPQVRKAEGIHRYFRPSQDQEFRIAFDDTATVEKPSSPRDAQSTSPSSRPPLQPLRDSAMNRLREQPENPSPSSSGDERDASQTSPGPPQMAFESPLPGRGQLPADERRRRLVFSPPAGAHVLRDTTPSHGPSVSRGAVPFPTPPSSGPIRGEGQPSRGRGSRGRPGARAGFARGRGGSATGSSIRPSIFSPMASSPSMARAAAISSHEPRKKTGGEAGMSLAKLPPANKPYSHTTQALLMRTPSPEAEEQVRRVRRKSGTETPHRRVKLWNDGWTAAGSDTDFGRGNRRRQSTEEPRLRRLSTRRPSSRRQSSTRLPLETISDGARVRTLQVSCDEVQRRMKQLVEHDSYMGRGQLTEALPVEDMMEATEVSSRLRVAVGAWQAKNDVQKVEVDLKLLLPLPEVRGER
ncbi:hypothetical protein CP532_1094 [Ophiocordyceps camponoti-leonardi (nom. inval.)]|nr:hypothetical protein CP532_1094 [Ophiocordyceps camponoti-leonardi (nom. inval.)]